MTNISAGRHIEDDSPGDTSHSNVREEQTSLE